MTIEEVLREMREELQRRLGVVDGPQQPAPRLRFG